MCKPMMGTNTRPRSRATISRTLRSSAEAGSVRSRTRSGIRFRRVMAHLGSDQPSQAGGGRADQAIRRARRPATAWSIDWDCRLAWGSGFLWVRGLPKQAADDKPDAPVAVTGQAKNAAVYLAALTSWFMAMAARRLASFSATSLRSL